MSWQNVLDLLWLFFLLFLLWHFWRSRLFLAQAKGWLTTKGRITVFEWAGEGSEIGPRIQYTYQVFDQDYYSEQLFLDTSDSDPNSQYARRIAYRAAMAYADEADIMVFYNPDNPSQAALDIRIPPKLNLIIALLLILIILHLVMVLRHFLYL